MTNVTTAITTEVKTTVLLDWTSSQIVRIKVNQPLPEYGLREGQVVYLVKSDSLNKGYQGDGTWYYILTWNYATMEWQCPCKGFQVRRQCRHLVATKNACTARVARCKAIAQKIVARIMNMPLVVTVKQEVPHRYCDICTCALPLQMVNGKHVCSVCASHTSSAKENAPLQGRGYTIVNGIPMR